METSLVSQHRYQQLLINSCVNWIEHHRSTEDICHLSCNYSQWEICAGTSVCDLQISILMTLVSLKFSLCYAVVQCSAESIRTVMIYREGNDCKLHSLRSFSASATKSVNFVHILGYNKSSSIFEPTYSSFLLALPVPLCHPFYCQTLSSALYQSVTLLKRTQFM
jgi:hypothetical protein